VPILVSRPPEPVSARTDAKKPGIGKETVKVLLSRNAKVYIAGRGGEKTERAIADLKDITGREAHFIQCDLADLHSIKAAVQEFTT